jgi:hypothetical protein
LLDCLKICLIALGLGLPDEKLLSESYRRQKIGSKPAGVAIVKTREIGNNPEFEQIRFIGPVNPEIALLVSWTFTNFWTICNQRHRSLISFVAFEQHFSFNSFLQTCNINHIRELHDDLTMLKQIDIHKSSHAILVRHRGTSV